MIRLAVAGAKGRMGRCVLDLASRDSRFEIASALDRSAQRTLPACDVLIDFTLPAGTMAWLEVCRERRTPMVIGVTGHDERQSARIVEAARTIPIVQAANFSVGMNAVMGMLAQLVRQLGEGYDVEIVETHHRNKVDAPSGTTKTMVEQIIAGSTSRTRSASDGASVDPSLVVHGRSGRVGERPRGQIGVHSVRMGEIIGSHEIHLSGPGETVTIRHTAHSRDTFAAGAVRAAMWIVDQPPGLYSMSDLIGRSA